MNAKRINWEHFARRNEENPHSAFEAMCRVLFAYMLGVKTRDLNSSSNNPGIEVHPVENRDIQRVSFQRCMKN